MKNHLQLFFFFFLIIFSVKLNAQNAPAIEWQKCFGGSDGEIPYSIQQTFDSGFIVAGESTSDDGDVSGNHGYHDYWIIKLDSNENLVWQKCLGGDQFDVATSIQQTADSGFIVAGSSYSSNSGDVYDHHGPISYSDYWVVKLDASGNIEWKKSYG